MDLSYYVEFKVLPDNLFRETEWFYNNILSKGGTGIARVFDVAAEHIGTENRYTPNDFRVSDVSPTHYSLCFVIDFIAGNNEPALCKNVIITFDFDKKVTARYFTVEYGDDGRCFLGEVDADGGHENYGFAPPEDELVEKVIMLAFGWSEFGGFDEEENLLKSTEEYVIPSLLSFVENIYLKALFDYETPMFMHELFNKERFFIYSVIKRVCMINNQPVPFGMTDILVESKELDDENKVLYVIDMPKYNLCETECIQIYIAYDIEKVSRRYITLNYEGDNKASINCYDIEKGNSGPFVASTDEKEFYDTLLQIAFD